jgi:hypothetical protein
MPAPANVNNMMIMTSTRNTALAILFVTAFLVFWLIMIFSNGNKNQPSTNTTIQQTINTKSNI